MLRRRKPVPYGHKGRIGREIILYNEFIEIKRKLFEH